MNKEKDEDKGPKSRYLNVIRKWNELVGLYVDVDVDIDGKKAEDKLYDDVDGGIEGRKAENGEIAFTFRKIRNYGQGGGPKEESEIDFEAEGLRNLVKKINGKDYPGQNLEGETVNIIAPYAALASCVKIHFIHEI